MTQAAWRELFLYVAASAGALAVDVSVLALLVHGLRIHYLLAASLAFTAGIIVAYVLCIKFVFGFRRMDKASAEFGIFWGIGILGLTVNAAAMAIGVEVLELQLLVAKMGAAGTTCMMNFALRKLLLFTQPRPAGAMNSGDVSQ